MRVPVADRGRDADRRDEYGRRPRILVAAYNPISRKLYRHALEADGYEVIECADGGAAIEASGRERPDLVVQEMLLADGSGLELAKRLRALDEGMALVGIAGIAPISSGVFDDILTKPVGPGRLVETVRALAPGQRAAHAGRGAGRLALIAASDSPRARLRRAVLSSLGFRVALAEDGDTALEAIRQERPDVVVADALLDGIGGLELACILRRDESLARIPLVLVGAAEPDPADADLAMSVGAVAFLAPADPWEIARAITGAFDGDVAVVRRGPPSAELIEAYTRELERRRTAIAHHARRDALKGILLSFAAALSDSIATSVDAELSLDDVLRALADATEVDRSAVFLLGESGLRVAASCGFRATERETLDRLCVEDGVVRRSMSVRKVLAVDGALGLRSGCVAPLGSSARPAGAILLGSETRPLDGEWDLFARGIGAHLGEALATSRLLARVAASEQRYRSLLENANDGIVVLGSDGLVIEVNNRAEEMFGRLRADLIGKGLVEIAAPVARLVERLILERALRSESVVIELPGGGSITAELSARIVETRAGRQAIAIARDVSERSRLESQLHQAQKMEAVGRLTGGIAHDFNNVLAIVLAHASFLLTDLPPDDRRHADAKEIRQAAERAAGLTRQLLAFSRKQVLEPVVLDMNVHVADMAKLLPRVLGPSIALATALSPDLGSVRVDPIQLEQVVMNLAINAKDAMPDGGRLLLETSNVDLDEDFGQAHPIAPGPYVLLTVSDTGCGMDAETQRHLFEPFFTTKERGKGTGLGLSTCYGIVKQSGGYIWAFSEVGRGTTFKIYLPRVGDPPGHPGPRALLDTVRGTEKVFVVDDDEKVRALASRILKTHGYRVIEAEDVTPAIDRSADEDGTIDLLVADVLMPGGSGLDLAERLRASRPEMRVLLISGYTEQGLPRERMLEIRAAFLQKPFSPDALARKVREVLDG